MTDTKKDYEKVDSEELRRRVQKVLDGLKTAKEV